ncbi:MAG TPA: S8 family serine peptidase [Micromonosporaceae bacterium]
MLRRRSRTALVGLAVGLTIPLGAAGPAVADPEATAAQSRAAKAERKVIDQVTGNGEATFWVILDSTADLSGAAQLREKADKAAYVLRTKTAHANRTQAGLRRLLAEEGADFTPFWLVNAIKVTGDAELLDEIAVRSEVAQIVADDPIVLPDPQPAEELPTVDAVEWNIDRINAPRVWNELGTRGEGIVVANIDTGVEYQHPALANSYRGRNADGTYDHNYNWFDPAQICPTAAPCDNNNHGTHTMGTMVGLDGDNVIGVAPAAKWIAAKGCESSSCSRTSLLAAGQWIVAPTDLNGANPRPDLAPDIVNNSWGSSLSDPWYMEIVSSWVAAGIFPAFSNGNSGPSCNTSGSPGRYTISYSSGAFDVNNAIAGFSSRGAGDNGDIKPNIAAPGVSVRSATRTGYASYSGTSMASPHTAATVALMWSASPAIQGDIAETRRILDETAIDVADTTCGGTADDNNVWGEGRLDAYAAVLASPRGALGALTGRVTSGGAALAGATVTVTGPMVRSTTTGDDGSYRFDPLMVGDYTVTVGKFGYLPATATATIAENESTVLDIAVEQAPSASLSGTVTTSAGAAAGARIVLPGTPLSATADEQGRYALTVPHGEYRVEVTHPYRCADSVTRTVTVAADTTLDIALPDRTDGFGYACQASDGAFVGGTERFNLTGDDQAADITLPFKVPLYGKAYRTGWISTNGVFGFGTRSTSRLNRALPYTTLPNLALFAFWDDLVVDAQSGIYTATVGARPHRTFVVEWRNVTHFSDRNQRLTFSAAISEDGTITYRYHDITGDTYARGSSATIGLENADGTDGFEYSLDSVAVADGTTIAFRSTRTGVVSGVVTDANDGLPLTGATVSAQAGEASVEDVTDADGGYLIQVPTGDARITVSAAHYEESAAEVTLSAGAVLTRSVALRTARITTPTEELSVIAGADQTRARQLQLSNTGALGTDVTVTELNADGHPQDIGWLSLTGAAAHVASGQRHTIGITVDTTGLAPGSFHHAKLQISSASGRRPVIVIPVTLVVPGYVLAIDVGDGSGHLDAEGQSWTSDRGYAAGGAGYLGNSHTLSTRSAIDGTDDQARYGDLREGMYEYRIDGLVDGYYTVELNFAELRAQDPNKRIFDVHLEGQQVLPALDVAGEVGSFAALTKTYTVRVSDGQLNVRFVTHKGYGKPILNALRVMDRPDLTP